MFTHHQTKGIILRIREIREADNIFTAYTHNFGMIDVCGKSIRKGKSKLKMNMTLFSCVDLGFIQGKSYNTLVDANAVFTPYDVYKNLGKLSLLYRMSELVVALIRGQEKDSRLFSFLQENIKDINKKTLSTSQLKAFWCIFSFRLLYFLGYKIYTDKCVMCGQEINKDCYFSCKEGGVVCRNCLLNASGGIYIKDVKLLRSLFLQNSKEDIINQDINTCLQILSGYLAFIPETENIKI